MNEKRKTRLAWVGIVALALAALMAIAIAVNQLAPYRPFIVRSYVVYPQTVCEHGKITATITRRFTHPVTEFHIKETWVTARAKSHVQDGRPKFGHGGKLPTKDLKPSADYKTAISPVLYRAPSDPGRYRVRIETEARGTRLGLPTSGSAEFYSDNVITVKKCDGK